MAYSASDFKNIKSRLKAEMNRRNGVGAVNTVTSQAGYEYTTAPAAGGDVKTEHFNKLVKPLKLIDDTNMPAKDYKVGDEIPDDDFVTLMRAKVAALEAVKINDKTNSGCKSSCTGTCKTSCTGTCVGACSGCSSGCSGGCDGCSGSCTASCGNNCTGCSGCSSGCSGGCDTSCGYT